MKKLISLLLVLCLAFTAVSALAEEDDNFDYLAENPNAKPFDSVWVAANGDWRAEVFIEDGGPKISVIHKLEGKLDVWEYTCDLTDKTLVSSPFGLHYLKDISTGDWDKTYYEDGEARFSINEAGKLVWADQKEDAGKGLEFDRIGSFCGSRWMKGADIEVIFYDWYDGEYDIRVYQYGKDKEILKDAILKGTYDAASDTVTAVGEFEGEKPMTITFSYDANHHVVWTENGQSTTMEFSLYTD